MIRDILSKNTVLCAVMVSAILLDNIVTAQCLNAPHGQYPGTTYTPSCLGSVETITAFGWAGEYSMVALEEDIEYTFSSSIGTDFLTISNAAGVIAYVWGTGSVIFTPEASGNYRFYTHTNPECGTATINRARRMQCESGAPGICLNAPHGQFPGTTFIPACNGQVENITTQGWAGEYSMVLLQAGTEYEFSSSIGTDYITISNAAGTIAYEYGTQPVTFTPTAGDAYRFYTHTDSNCGDEVSERTRSIFCEPNDPGPCLLAPFGQNPVGIYSPGCTGQIETITTNGFAGQYSMVALSADVPFVYMFSSSNSNDHITISNEDGTEALAFGTTPLNFSPPSSGHYRFYTHLNASCGFQSVARHRRVLCDPLPCLNDPYGQWPPVVFAPGCGGNPEQITQDGRAGEYSVVALLADVGYVFTSSVNTDFITISDEEGINAIAEGMTPFLFTPDVTGNYRFYTHRNTLCGVENAERTRSIACGDLEVVPCLDAPYGQHPQTTYTPACAGFVENITTNGWAGEYSKVALQAGTEYVFSSSVIEDHITISNEEGTLALAFGITPLSFTAAFSATYRFYTHANAGCVAEPVNRTRKVICGEVSDPGICLNAPFGQAPSFIYEPQCFGIDLTITSFTAGSYSMIALTGGVEYLFSSTINTDYITISDELGTEGLVFGTTPVSFTPSETGNYRFYTHTNAECGVEQVNSSRSLRVRCAGSGFCLNAPFGQWPENTFTPVCNGTAEVTTTQGWAGEYSMLSLMAQVEYTFASSVETDHITITLANGTIITSGTSPVMFTPEHNSTYRMYTHVNAHCDTEEVDRTRSISCSTPYCLNAPFGQWPSTTFTPTCTGAVQNITTNGWAGEYSMVALTAGLEYIFSSSVTTDYITVSDFFGTLFFVWGTGPLSFTPSVSNTYRFYTHTDEDCGTEDTNRARRVMCTQPDPEPCLDAVHGQWPVSPYTPVCAGTTETIVSNGWAGEYSMVVLSVGRTYTFTSSINTDNLTISDETGTEAFVWGTGTVIFAPDLSGHYRFYTHTRFNCGTQQTNRARRVLCQLGEPVPCLNAPFGQWPMETFTPVCAGIEEAITTEGWAGEYSVVTLQADVEYTLSSSVTSDIITVSDASGSMPYVWGRGQVVFTPEAGGEYRVYTHRTEACEGADVIRMRKIMCGSAGDPAACMDAPYGQGSVSPYQPECQALEVIAAVWAGQYVTLALDADVEYIFASSTGTDYLTIANHDGDEAYAFGTSPIDFTPEMSGTYRLYVHAGGACTADQQFRTLSMRCGVPGCLSSPYGQFPLPYTPVCNGLVNSITNFGWAGEYSMMILASDQEYILSSSNVNDMITISDEFGNTVLQSGIGSVSFIPSTDGSYRFYTHANQFCGALNQSRSRRVQCGQSEVICLSAPFGQFPDFPFTPACIDAPEIITSSGWAGEYSMVVLLAGVEYSFASSTVSDYIKISDEGGTQVFAEGVTPVSFTPLSAAQFRFYTYTNENCGSQSLDRLRTVHCLRSACLDAPYGQWPETTFIPDCAGAQEVITDEGWAGQFSVVDLSSNARYLFTSSIDTDHLTISDEDGGVMLAEGSTPLAFTPETDGLYRFYTHTNPGCQTEQLSRTRGLWCGGCLDAPFGRFPQATFHPTCSGFQENIVMNGFAGEYSMVALIAGMTYTFASSVGSDQITISDFDGTIPFILGAGSVVFTPAESGSYRFYTHADATCGASLAHRTRSVTCTAVCLDAPYGQWPESVFTPSCPGYSEHIATDAKAGQYSMVALTADVQYIFSGSVLTDHLTVSDEEGLVSLVSGMSPVMFTPVSSGNYRFYTHTGINCGTLDEDRVRSIRCDSPAMSHSEGDYRSAKTGSWFLADSWERFDGTDWQPAIVPPSDSDGMITIRNTHTILVNTTVTADEVVVEEGGVLLVASVFTIADGPGDDLVVYGTLQLPGTIQGNGSLVVYNDFTWTGTIQGSGAFSVYGNATWLDGTLSRPFNNYAGNTFSISNNHFKTLSTSIINQGTILWKQGFISVQGSGLSLINDGIFVIESNNGFTLASGSSLDFTNNGTVRKTTSGTVSFLNVQITNNALFDLVGGGLWSGHITNNGTFHLTNGNILIQTFHHMPGSVIQGTGEISVSSLGTLHLHTDLELPPGIEVVCDGVIQGDGDLIMHGDLTLSGTIQGAGTFVSNGNTNWMSGGTLSREMHNQAGGKFTWNGTTNSPLTLSNSIINDGVIDWLNGSVVMNAEGHTLTNNGVMTIYTREALFGGLGPLTATPGPFELINNGSLRKTGGGNLTFNRIDLINHGDLHIEGGDFTSAGSPGQITNNGMLRFNFSALRIENTFHHNTGSMILGTGHIVNAGMMHLNDHLELPSPPGVILFTNTGTVQGDGDLTVNHNFTLTGIIQGDGAFDVNGNTIWTSGILDRHFANQNNRSFFLRGGGMKTISKPFANDGSMIWEAGNITVTTDELHLTGNSMFSIRGNHTLSSGSGPFLLRNAGIINKTGHGITTIDNVHFLGQGIGLIKGQGTILLRQE